MQRHKILYSTRLCNFALSTDFHDYLNIENITVYSIQFSAESVGADVLSAGKNLFGKVFQLDEDIMQSIETLCGLLKSSLSSHRNAKATTAMDDYRRRILEALLLLTFGHAMPTHPADEIPLKTIPSQIQKAIAYMESHFSENPTMSEMVERLYLNENYFCGLFRKNVGESYKSYLRKLKLNHAAKLLISTESNVTNIAMESGYNSQSHFNREFKAFFGIAPLEMRQREQIDHET